MTQVSGLAITPLMKIIGEDGCSVVVRFGFGGENSAEGGRCFLKRGTRFKKREADASTLGSASRQGAWLTPRRAKATEPASDA